MLNGGLWPSLAVSAVAYTLIATALAGRSFGMMASEWVIKMVRVRSFSAGRRRVSPRVERA